MNKCMKKLKHWKIAALILISGLIFSSCSQTDDYDKGYDDAWDGKKNPSSFWSSKKETAGYEAGLSDAYAYDDGYADAIDSLKPRYPNDVVYMDGYKCGKRDK